MNKVVGDLGKCSIWLPQVTRNYKCPPASRKTVTVSLWERRCPFVLLAWIFDWSHRNINCFVPKKSSQWKQPKLVLFCHTRSYFSKFHRERFYTNYSPVLLSCHCYRPPTWNECLKWGEVQSPVPGAANHHFIWHHFLNQNFLQYHLKRSLLLLSWEDQGHAIGSLSISLYFKSLCLITSHCLQIFPPTDMFFYLWRPFRLPSSIFPSLSWIISTTYSFFQPREIYFIYLEFYIVFKSTTASRIIADPERWPVLMNLQICP